ncbi:hypothetical protein BKA04_001848 [Cryobacterium mesophilum]|uniref:Large exoprotein n=1 Tax=Terrimesophilobacter mesophilus TaxID=433647 RepID=A0A4R8VBG6_9MICO|nr:hypothetical protein [Terrimesophilobacter mesophilus]MBB5633625.1 hypothetical protein [Terrimesophilobacter mesophilus]TFB80319.1 hypothetical protein E3N84_09930 [Terrimesophilobacter mesophilus]
MGIDGVGSSVVIALAAVLWFLYLIPTWLKRREYLATERNAVRLQQTMRVLAESAEVPSVVRVEATARAVAAQQRALRRNQRGAGARAAFAVPETTGSGSAGIAPFTAASTARRLRRSRAFASVVLLASIVAGGFGWAALVSEGSWLLLAVSVVVALGALGLLSQAAAVTRARTELRRAAIASPTSSELHDHADYAPARPSGWTPVPVPKPLYLSRPASAAPAGRVAEEHSRSAASTERRIDHAAALRVAAAEAESALRAAQASPEVTRIASPSMPTESAPSRFASMGILDPAGNASADLDEILRRRRAVG